ncbi:hypothetical protein AAGU66_01945 [Edwardsiella ictaluri]|uniref:Uncharacterized protein n=2 Tax=Edwardsiella ictaluri TaxID=67780 RepID=C5BFC4_EDWI9|nr:hypothetical protein [Edwardsiella ictaluri]ACR67709.1 hypothetical protein NT01EI_0474 [Edwardsiella ictaluri 93-146]EKS7762161.1 hypothetical protein [Edwardsiella ictaluri]EKS7768988.1 hypothetical protein [Edwardsiella ictaluri]EKS7772137.1 hypothetical protein [Edwardsiella ictaluri]EKS7775525.1 hypothetical protein [Edwardsiella ictaluri]
MSVISGFIDAAHILVEYSFFYYLNKFKNKALVTHISRDHKKGQPEGWPFTRLPLLITHH